MIRKKLFTLTVVGLTTGLLVVGCKRRQARTQSATRGEATTEILPVLQDLYGPPRSRKSWFLENMVKATIRHDFSDDGQDEVLLLLSPENEPAVRNADLAGLRKGVVTEGFVLFARVRGRFRPIFYYFNAEQISLAYKTVGGHTGLVEEGRRGGGQTIWFWSAHGKYNWRHSEWIARYRTWDQQRRAYAGWKLFPQFQASYGK
jgi:hypothetical protein